MGGTYCLLIHLAAESARDVGALGTTVFPAGWYAYVGSALGPGGFARLDRHRQVAAGERHSRHWHIDSLLAHPAAGVVGEVRAQGADAECAVADSLDGEPVADFGCTDCGCGSHLFRYDRRERAREDARSAHATAAQAGVSR